MTVVVGMCSLRTYFEASLRNAFALVALSLTFFSGQAAAAMQITVTDLKYGNAEVSWSKRTGSHIMRQPNGWKIQENETEIPLEPSSQIAYEMRLRSDEAREFTLLRRLERPNGEASRSVVSVRNGRKTKAAFHFHEDAKPGKWRLSVSIIGIDGVEYDPNATRGDLRVLDLTFDVYLSKGIDEVVGFHQYSGIDLKNVAQVCY